VDSYTDYYDPELKRENAGELDVLEADILSVELEALLDGVDGMFHLAGQPGVRSFGDVFPLYLRRNLHASQRVFEAAAAAGVRVVFASSSSVSGAAEASPTPETGAPAPRPPYGITKLGCEHLARAYGRDFRLDAVVLRYFTVYGPRQRPDMLFARVVRALAEGGTIELYGGGAQSRSFTYVDDVVEATVAAMERAPAAALYNVGGGEEASLPEAIALLERLSGRTLDVRHGPAEAGDVPRTKADTTRIEAELGWQARTPLEEGLRAQWEWARARVGAR
jgi:nucleoside-diphosphate-sugar epimerase